MHLLYVLTSLPCPQCLHIIGDFLALEAGDLVSGDLNRRAANYACLNQQECEFDGQDLAALMEDYSKHAQQPAM